MATIVVGFDGSDNARDALRWSVREAALRRCDVLAVNAWEIPIVSGGMGMIPTPLPEEEFADAATRVIASATEVARAVDPAVHVETRAIAGSAVGVLVDEARETGADLIVVGSRGHGAIAGLLLGSVSQQVAHHAHCPVVIVPPVAVDGDGGGKAEG